MALNLRALQKEREANTGKQWNAAERSALAKLQREARDAGATLMTGGEGGMRPSLVLGTMRRDKYRCKRCGTGDALGVHHKGGLDNPASAWLAAKGKRNEPNNIVTLCAACHDAIHMEDRAAGARPVKVTPGHDEAPAIVAAGEDRAEDAIYID